ncbi:TetR/AcrR family transcriptional regulator [Actinomadura sp. 21ATH]|uniref:TetR/AcrR family transcriptional regulator n=1 Tax=Actinomadura sp. 21ATH TaxID=1735444 RepID=UPI0035C20918
MVSPAAERGREVRRRLLQAAAELIPERGWTAVSTRILAERAGVTPSVVHYHYPSVNALLNEAVTAAMRDFTAGLRPLLDAAGSPAEVVEALLASVERSAGEEPGLLLFMEAFLAAARDEPLREAIAGAFLEFRNELARRFDEQGVPSPERTAAAVMAVIDGLVLHRALAPAPDGTAEVLRRLVG